MAFACVGFALSLVGCNNSPDESGLVGSYAVTISGDQPITPDHDVVSIQIGEHASLLLLFEAGITTDLMGPNPNGLISSWDGMNLMLQRQPAHVQTALGDLDGFMTGDGTLPPDGSSITLNLHYEPTSGPMSGDGGAAILNYTVMGMKTM
jgi:hypothetical protein